MPNTQKNQKNQSTNKKQSSGTENRGFASMPREKVSEIASKGGKARAKELGHKGYSEMGKVGGKARAEQLGPEGYAEMGKAGGAASHGGGRKRQQ
jgi:Small hydrophilic plant seed protein.